MNLVKWLRKNNKKIMAVAVVIIMLGFVGGTYLQQLGQRRTGQNKAIAAFGVDSEITNDDLLLARQELEIMRMLRADALLKNIQLPMTSAPDLRALFLGELLFTDRQISPMVIARTNQIIQQSAYRISSKQINALYHELVPKEIYWLLLKKETEQIGIVAPTEEVGELLASTTPQFFNGASYSQVMRSMIEQGISEEMVLETMAKLMAVLEYSKQMCSGEDFTSSQLKHNITLEQETIDVEFVKFDSDVFARTAAEPSAEEISGQFEKFRDFFAGDLSEMNPYGFGYKLPAMVGLEYIVVKLSDISKLVSEPTQQELEVYYQKYRQRLFVEQVPSDPNDPNSMPVNRIKSYAEVADEVSKNLMQQKINSKAERVLKEAKTITEAAFGEMDLEISKLTEEQLTQMAGDYNSAAEQLREKYNIKVYCGQTGLLSASQMRGDKYLGRFYVAGSGYSPVALNQLVFSIEPLGLTELSPFAREKPKMYENIGPVKDAFGQLMMMVRVIKAKKASVPEDINKNFRTDTLQIDEPYEQAETTWSVKEKIIKDLKKLLAMTTTKNKADEFILQIVKKGWKGAIEKFNKLYEQERKADVSDPNTFKLQKLTGLQRIAKAQIETLAIQNSGDPAMQFMMYMSEKEKKLIEKLYELVPQDDESLKAVPMVFEFKPDMSYYCLKSLSVKPFEKAQYEKLKAIRAYKEDIIQSQSLAVVHFNPENILKRMKFRAIREDVPKETEVPEDSEGTF